MSRSRLLSMRACMRRGSSRHCRSRTWASSSRRLSNTIPALAGCALPAAYKKSIDDLTAAEQAKAPAGSSIRIQMLDGGYFFYLYQTHEIKDIRVVYAPPKNIGIFGGDPDNFEWTRHTGDFTFLRA